MYGQGWSFICLFGPVWSWLVLFGPVWSCLVCLVLFGTVWSYLVLIGSIWSWFVLFGYCLVMYDPCLVLFGPDWSWLVLAGVSPSLSSWYTFFVLFTVGPLILVGLCSWVVLSLPDLSNCF